MRFKREVLSLLILLACLAPNTQGIFQPSDVTPAEGQSLADALLEDSVSGSGIMEGGDARFAPSPQTSRKVWQNESNATNWTMPSTLSGTSSSAKESRSAAEAQSSVAATEETASTTQTTASTETAPATTTAASPIAGSWSLKLSDSAERQADITLFQVGDVLFGAGNLDEDNNTLQVAASGSVLGDEMNLDITSTGPISLYRLALNLSGDSADGDYHAFSASGDSWTGSASGTRTVPQE
ncbi:MAG TPA: hypothetical protein VLY86_01065 [Methanothrix sp.]|nr:hypothetical protein [Methanothrix sp.]